MIDEPVVPVFMFELPTIIDGPGEYETRCGERVDITSIGRTYHDCFECRGAYQGGVSDVWNVKGRVWRHKECRNDIVRRVGVSDVKGS